MKKLFFLLGLFLLLASCGTSRKAIPHPRPEKAEMSSTEQENSFDKEIMENSSEEKLSKKAIKISKHAKSFLGTRYKYGGTTKNGMDCSGLVYTAFLKEGVDLPRISRKMSLQGTRLFLKEVSVGDLLFFETNKNQKVINHVGLVVERDEKDIYFIHSSSSRGVIISKLDNPYWQEHFVMARRVL